MCGPYWLVGLFSFERHNIMDNSRGIPPNPNPPLPYQTAAAPERQPGTNTWYGDEQDYLTDQPEPGRITLRGWRRARTGGALECCCYDYVDEIPRDIGLAIVATVCCTILATPVILLCCLPLIFSMKKVSYTPLAHCIVVHYV